MKLRDIGFGKLENEYKFVLQCINMVYEKGKDLV